MALFLAVGQAVAAGAVRGGAQIGTSPLQLGGHSKTHVATAAVPTISPAVPPSAIAATDPRLWEVGPGSSEQWVAHMTPDGAHLYVESGVPLNPGDPGGRTLYDLYAGQARVVTTGGSVNTVTASADGRVVTFWSDARLAAADTNNATDLYLEIDGVIHLVGPGFANAEVDAIAPDGAAVVFRNFDSVLPGDSETNAIRADLYRWDRATDTVTLLTPGTESEVTYVGGTPSLDRVLFEAQGDLTGELGGDVEQSEIYERLGGTYHLRATGSYSLGDPARLALYFNSVRPWAPEDVDGMEDGYTWNGADDTYALMTPDTTTSSNRSSIAPDESRWVEGTADALIPADTNGTWDTYLVGVDAAPVMLTGLGQLGVSGATPDLGVLVISTNDPLVAADTDARMDLYRLDTAHLEDPVLLTPGPMDTEPWTGLLALSPDGNRIAIQTEEALVPEDTDGLVDVYVWEPGRVVLVTPGTETAAVAFNPMAATDVGRIVFRWPYQTVISPAGGGPSDWFVADFDITPPTALIGGPSGPTASTTADLTFATADGDGAKQRCRVDAGTWAVCPGTMHLTHLAQGLHQVEMRAWDAWGNVAPAQTVRRWSVDTVHPTATAPVASVRLSTEMGVTRPVVRITWSGADKGVGIASSRLEQQVDSGAWVVIDASIVGFSTSPSLSGGHTYRYRVSTRDAAGNRSIAATASPFTLRVVQESSTTITYSGTWGSAASASFMAGKARWTRSHGARASLGFTGRAVSVIATTGPTRGSVAVWIDGRYRTTVDLGTASARSRTVVFRASWTASAAHRIVLVAAGTAGHPRVDVDAFVILR